MDKKITLKNGEDDKDEEWHPLNAMVTENIKDIIIRRIYRDGDKTAEGRTKIKSTVFRQYLAALGPVIAALSSGMSAGYSAILLPQLMAPDTEIVITKNEGSWIASMLALPLILGCLFSGYLMDTMGRKLSFIISCIPFTIGWIVLAFAPNVAALYAGRFITGFCVGLISPICQVFIAETCEPQHRGILLSGAPLSIAIGIFISHILGTFFTWRVTAGICGLPPLICISLLILVYESPMWRLQRGMTKDAEKAFRWYRGESEEATKEFYDLASKSNKSSNEQNEKTSKIKLYMKSSFLKPFMVLNFFFLVQQFSGVNAIAFYSVTILKEVMTSLDEYLSTILIDIIRFIASVVAVLLLKTFGRKQLSLASAIGTAISLFLLAIYLGCVPSESISENLSANVTSGLNLTHADYNETLIEDLPLPQAVPLYMQIASYLPLLFLISYICFVSIGLVPIPWILIGELFSKDVRGMGSGGCSSFGFLCYFVVVKLTPDLFENLGHYGTFCFFGVVSLVGCLVLAFYLPETKDKTLMEIEAFYTKKPLGEQNGRSLPP